MESINKKRKGFSLVELLIAIVVLGIITGMIVNSGIKAQQKARVSSATVALNDFAGAFSTACLQHPGVMNDRLDAWGEDGTGYSTKKALERAVVYINGNLDSQYAFTWSDTDKCYVSLREDPWGGRYHLYEYPFTDEDATGAKPPSDGDPAIRLSIWATGNDDKILTEHVVGKDSIGVALMYQSGEVTTQYNGVENQRPFTDYKLLHWESGVITP